MVNLAKVKALFRDNRVTGGIYKRAYSVYYQRFWPRLVSRRLKNRGPDILRQLCADLEKAPMPVFAVYGTLLGFMREGTFISFDNDLDFGVLANGSVNLDTLFEWMQGRGYHPTHFFSIDGNMVEFSIEVSGLSIDFFWFGDWQDLGFGSFIFFNEDGAPTEDLTRRVSFLRCNPIESTSTLSVYGIDVPIPSKPEQFLADIFTENWRIPDPNWVSEEGPAWNELNETKGILTQLK